MRLAGSVKRSFVAGVLLVTPLVVTAFVVRVVVGWTTGLIDPVVAWTGLTRYTANDRLVAQGLAVVLIVGALTTLGYLVQRPTGRRVFGSFGRIVTFVPLVDTIYSSVKQVASSLVDRDSRYESVVLVEYPREGVYSVGLVTAESPAAVETLAGTEAYNVFLPGSPNPTGGRLLLVPADQIHETDMTVREGLRLLVTTGMGAEEDEALVRATDGTAAET